MNEYITTIVNATKCAICKSKKCPLRYQPNRQKCERIHGTRYVTRCPKEEKERLKRLEKDLNKVLKRKLP